MNKIPKPGQVASKAAGDQWSMENVETATLVLSERAQRDVENSRDPPNEGVYVHGLWLEGCKWKRDSLDEATEKKMTYPLNILHVFATSTAAKGRGPDAERRENAYNCPVYKYPCRTDRYIVFRVLLPCVGGSTDANKWKLRGVALLCSTD